MSARRRSWGNSGSGLGLRGGLLPNSCSLTTQICPRVWAGVLTRLFNLWISLLGGSCSGSKCDVLWGSEVKGKLKGWGTPLQPLIGEPGIQGTRLGVEAGSVQTGDRGLRKLEEGTELQPGMPGIREDQPTLGGGAWSILGKVLTGMEDARIERAWLLCLEGAD